MQRIALLFLFVGASLAHAGVVTEDINEHVIRMHFSKSGTVKAVRPPTPMVVPQPAFTGKAKNGAEGLAELSFEENDGTIRLIIEPSKLLHAYGLGEHFHRPASPDGDLTGRIRKPANEYGNAMESFNGGFIGNDQIPVCYFLGEGNDCFAIFVDESRPMTWDFRGSPWTMEIENHSLTLYVIHGQSLPELRKQYMQLTGRPPVPPKTAFGLWISEYGYDNWDELGDKLTSLMEARFPLDGFVLDLQWFGDIEPGGDKSRMGRLAWDRERFPNPAARVAALRDKYGVGIVTIEESYVTRTLPVYEQLKQQDLLVKKPDGSLADFETWWGAGGMLDWSNPKTRSFWHETKRKAIASSGVIGHWTDLGEPETYTGDGVYHGLPELGWNTERDLHNLYNLLWAQGIVEGYAATHPQRRPWILSRSGTAGIQRYSTAQWSGDIGSNLRSLGAHMNVQMHMSLSGIDYYGADIGGFNRWSVESDPGEMYGRWFAHGALLDVPVRPHTSNRENKYETAPDRIGSVESNLAAIRLRYQLVPYMYALAHEAWRTGEAFMPPLVYHFQDDLNVRELGRQKMIGSHLMLACATTPHQTVTYVYLPAGVWTDYRSARRYDSDGRWFQRVRVNRDERIEVPLLARAGAIIPEMHVDDMTMNVHGKRRDASKRDELIVRVFPGPDSQFRLYEDDGKTQAYREGAVRITSLQQTTTDNTCQFTLAQPEGTYKNAPSERTIVTRFVLPPKMTPVEVQHNGKALKRLAENAAPLTRGYRVRGSVVEACTGTVPVAAEHRFEVRWDQNKPAKGE